MFSHGVADMCRFEENKKITPYQKSERYGWIFNLSLVSQKLSAFRFWFSKQYATSCVPNGGNEQSGQTLLRRRTIQGLKIDQWRYPLAQY